MAKEVLIGRDAGANVTELSNITGLDSSTVSRRCDAANLNAKTDPKLAYAKERVEKEYRESIAESQA